MFLGKYKKEEHMKTGDKDKQHHLSSYTSYWLSKGGTLCRLIILNKEFKAPMPSQLKIQQALDYLYYAALLGEKEAPPFLARMYEFMSNAYMELLWLRISQQLGHKMEEGCYEKIKTKEKDNMFLQHAQKCYEYILNSSQKIVKKELVTKAKLEEILCEQDKQFKELLLSFNTQVNDNHFMQIEDIEIDIGAHANLVDNEASTTCVIL